MGNKIQAHLVLVALGMLGLVGCADEPVAIQSSAPSAPKDKAAEPAIEKAAPLEIVAQEPLAQPVSAPIALTPGTSFHDCPNCPEMVVVPGGSFIMGSSPAEAAREAIPEDLAAYERPQHSVNIYKPFAMGKYAVTRAEFAAFVQETGYLAQGCYVFNGTDWKLDQSQSWQSPGFTQTDRHPVTCVNWHDAQAYIKWLNAKVAGGAHGGEGPYGLPSEAEWEYAARAGTNTSRYWGDGKEHQCENANGADLTAAEAFSGLRNVGQCRDGYAHTSPVGLFQANGFGLYDMLGNVWQWTADCWKDSYEGLGIDATAFTGGECKSRSVRGGSWLSFPGYLRSASRSKDVAEDRSDYSGFRLVKTLPMSASPVVVAEPKPVPMAVEVPAPLPQPAENHTLSSGRKVLAHIASFQRRQNAERAWDEVKAKFDLRAFTPLYRTTILPNGKSIIRVYASGAAPAVTKLCSDLQAGGIQCHLYDAQSLKMLR